MPQPYGMRPIPTFERRSLSPISSDAKAVVYPTSSVARAGNRHSCPYLYPLRVLGAHGLIEISFAVALDEPLFLGAPGFVHASTALHSGSCFNLLHPPKHMRVRADVEKFGGFINIMRH